MISDPTPADMSSIPKEYHKFSDIFNKTHADTLGPHKPYDLKIELKDGAIPPFGLIYSLSQSEMKAVSALCTYFYIMLPLEHDIM